MAIGISAPAMGAWLPLRRVALAAALILPAQLAMAQDNRMPGDPPRPLGTMSVTKSTTGADSGAVPLGTAGSGTAQTTMPVGTTGPSAADNLQLPGKVEQTKIVVQSEVDCVASLVCLGTEAQGQYAAIVAEVTAPLIVTAFVDIDAGDMPNTPERVQALLNGEGRHVVTRLGPIPEEYTMSTTLRARLGAVGAQPDGSVYWLPFDPGTSREVIWVGSPDSAVQKSYVQWAADPGTPVRAARAGVVGAVRTQTMQAGLTDFPSGLGNMIAVVHDDGTVAIYGRLDFRGVGVTVGQRVQPGQVIGSTGLTGLGPDPGVAFTLVTPLGPGQDVEVWPVQFQTTNGPLAPLPGASASAQ